ncbi:uncharacterized protein LOC114761425 [Neltuma alba]|uniref:uncharacterized protein LOC114761425 n=1 Tax=Neltuma alba TaxID=207710 RepID=UPI0010A3DAE5|nr:uncharacterized protein LOC114761425 [Prosopis alba]XP_028806616.1 uncharacterized protein LOC114761425 [Prosopis alba]
MKGVGYYDDRACYPSSNLSAFAQPFSVSKTTPKDVSAPYADLAEAADAIPSNQFPVHSRPYGYDFFPNPVRELDSTPSSKAYGCSSSQVLDPPTSQLPHFNTLGLASKDTFAYDQSSNNIKSSLAEAQPYYPSYISPSAHVVNPAAPDHWSTLDDTKNKSEIGYSGQRVGFWNQFAELIQGNSSTPVEAGGSFCSNEANLAGPLIEENLVNQGYPDVKASNNDKVLHCINTIGWEKHGVSVPVCVDQLDDKSCWWQTANSLPFNIPSTSIQGSPLVSHDTHYDNRLKLVTDSGSYHSSYNASTDQLLIQHDKPSLVDAGSSAPITGIDVGFSVGNIAAGGDLGSNNITNIKEAYPLPSPRSTGFFDSGPIHMHLNRDESTSANNVMLPDSHVSTGVVDYIFKARKEFQNPQASLNNLSLGFRNDEDVNLKSFENVDKCNPAVDSPCWKGAPATHFHSFDGSEALYPQHEKSNEENFSLNFEGPRNFRLDASNITEISCDNSKTNQVDNETDYLEKGLAGSSRKFSVANVSSEENNLEGAASTGCFEYKPIYDYGLHYLDDNSEMTENNVPSNKSTYDSESRFSNNEQQIMEEKMSQKQHTLSGACADAGVNSNEYSKYFTSDSAEPSPSLPSRAAASTAFKESAAKASTLKINIQILVDTMHNLSELLLFHCLNDTCELKENDCSVLSNVISNLNTCASKNAGQMFPVQDCAFPQPNPSKHVRKPHEPGQNARFEKPHLTKVDPGGSKVDHENLPVQEMKAHHFASGKLGRFSDSFPAKGDTDMMIEDNTIEALKSILTENFHDEEGAESQALLYKNLWLEAEAAICSMKCRARYNQMKIEMEKCSKRRDDVFDVEEQSKPGHPHVSTAQSSAAKGNVDLKEVSGLKFSPDLNKPCTLTPDDDDGQNLDGFILDSAVSGTSKEIGECEASTKATFYSCNYRDVNTCVDAANLTGQLSSEASHALDAADKLVSGRTDNEDQANFIRISPNPGNSKSDDYVSSVMARFCILKSRDEESCASTANTEELPSSMVSDALNPADKSFYGLTDSKNQATDFTQVNKDDDYLSSAMARLRVLKSRVEDSSSVSSEGQLLDGVESAGNRTDCPITRDASEAHSSNVSISPPIMHLSSYAAVELSTPKEFHPNLEDAHEIQPQGTYRFGIQLPTHYSDGFSSEWEHVKMEEFTGQSFKL